MGSSVPGSMADRSMANPSRRPSLVLENGSPTARKERLRGGFSEHSSSRPYQGDNQDALVMLVSCINQSQCEKEKAELTR